MASADIKLGYSCNCNCIHCVVADNRKKALKHLGKQDRSTEEYKQELDDSQSKGYDSVTFTGGEPTLRNDLLELVRYAHQLGFKIGMQTNGRRFKYKDYAEDFAPYNITYVIALHGPDETIHDSITRSKGSFAQTVEGIANLNKLGQKLMGKTVISKVNYKHLESISRLFLSQHIKLVNFAFPHALGNARHDFENVVPPYSDVVIYVQQAIDIVREYNKKNKSNVVVEVEAIPFCLMEGYESHSCDIKYLKEEKSEVKPVEGGASDWNKVRKSIKSKFPQCKQCVYNDICEGVWQEYPEKQGTDEFKPVKKFSRKLLKALEKWGIPSDNPYSDVIESWAREEIEELIGEKVTKLTRINKRSFKVVARSRQYFVKGYEKSDSHNVSYCDFRDRDALLKYLEEKEWKTFFPIKIKGIKKKDKYRIYELYEYVEGKAPERNVKDVRRIGRLLGSFHKISQSTGIKPKDNLASLVSRVIQIHNQNIKSFGVHLNQRLMETRNLLIKEFKSDEFNNLKKIALHSDPQIFNFYQIATGELYLIDFENIKYGPRVYDLAISVCSCCYIKDKYTNYNPDSELLRSLLDSYKENQHMDKEEIKFIYPCIMLHLYEQIVTGITRLGWANGKEALAVQRQVEMNTRVLEYLLDRKKSGYKAKHLNLDIAQGEV